MRRRVLNWINVFLKETERISIIYKPPSEFSEGYDSSNQSSTFPETELLKILEATDLYSVGQEYSFLDAIADMFRRNFESCKITDGSTPYADLLSFCIGRNL